jgi:hypothetical protein
MDLIALPRSTSRGNSSDLTKHFPALLPDGKRRRCAMCTLKQRDVEREDPKGVRASRYWCPDCEKGFCPEDCFREWHMAEKLEGRDFGPKRVRRSR